MELAYELYDGTKYTEEIAKLATGAYMVLCMFMRSSIIHSLNHWE